MEISDILKVNNLNTLGIDSRLKSNNAENKFQYFLEKSVKNQKSNAEQLPVENKKPIDKKLMDVCIEMESILVSRMLREMRNTIPEEKLMDGGFAEKIFEDMLYDEYALTLSKTSNLGLATMLYNELSRI